MTSSIPQVLDIDYLTKVGEFCKIYGGWAVSIFLGIFIIWLMKRHDKKMKTWNTWWNAERTIMSKKFDAFHNELVELSKKDVTVKNKLARYVKDIKVEMIAQTRRLDLLGLKKVKKDDECDDGLTKILSDDC